MASAAHAAALDPPLTICLRAVGLPIEGSDDDPRVADIQGRIVTVLEAGGYEVVAPSAVEGVLEAVENPPNLVDPYTGRVDWEAQQASLRIRLGRLQQELGCDVEMSVHVVATRAWWDGSSVHWDGLKEQVSSGPFVAMQMFGGVRYSGWLPTLSLWIRVRDLSGDQIAFRSTGIESLVEFSVSKSQDLLPEDRWLTNSEKLDRAVDLALGKDAVRLRLLGTAKAALEYEGSKRTARRRK